MSNLNLDEVSRLMTENPAEAFARMDEILEFAISVDNCATDILSSKDSKYHMKMLAMIQTLVATVMVSDESISIMDAIQIINSDFLTKYTILVMKMTVGLSVMEELR